MQNKLIDWDELNEQFPLVVGNKKKVKRLKSGTKYLSVITNVVVKPSSKNQQLQIIYDLCVNPECGESVPVKKFTQLIPEHEKFVAAELEFFGIEINHMSELSAKLQKLVGIQVVISISYKANFSYPIPSFVNLIDK